MKKNQKLFFRNLKIKKQMYMLYFFVLLVPIVLLGSYLTRNTRRMLDNYYSDLLAADNQRIKTLLSEVTIKTYNNSEEICFDSGLKNLLSRDYETKKEFITEANKISIVDNMIYSSQEIGAISIYTDNPTIYNYKQFKQITEDLYEKEWFQEAVDTTTAFWTSERVSANIRVNEHPMTLIRKMMLPDQKYMVIVSIELNDNYLRTRIDSNMIDAISIDDETISYSSKKNWYGMSQIAPIDYGENYYSFSGEIEENGKSYYANVSTTHLYKTNSKLYICTLNDNAVKEIAGIIRMTILIILIAILLPMLIMAVFTNYFTSRIGFLRESMHRASTEDYEIADQFKGHDELTETFEDLKIMIEKIKQKEAEMYQVEINERELKNKQQMMEYKMLASQINPHFLYNSLETIRMKALTGGDKEVANSIKILGKTLRYVLENTGTSSATLTKELDHIENYLMIQKLRFDDRVNYHLEISNEIDPNECLILPLLLQPVVENAVIHGLEEVQENGQIYVRVYPVGKDTMRIEVADNGCGMTQGELRKLNEKLNTPDLTLQSSIGLYNISQRIRLYYGKEYQIWVESKEKEGTTVSMDLPIIPA